jgi:precorrin-3B methylase
MTVAAHDRDLPVMLISGGDPALLGAIDAVEEIWQLTSVVRSQQLPGVGAIVDFLFRAGRRGNCMRLMPS